MGNINLSDIASELNQGKRNNVDQEEPNSETRTYETYLDVAEAIKVIFSVHNDSVSYEYSCDTDDVVIEGYVLKNLNKITSFEQTSDPDIYRLSLNNRIFIDFSKSTGKIVNVDKLISSETRLLAQGKPDKVPFSRENMSDFSPKTDLHNHYAGVLSPQQLIEIGKKHDVDYPVAFLKDMGIDTDKYEKTGPEGREVVKLNGLSEEDLKVLKRNLALSLFTQESFRRMEAIYSYRSPITKDLKIFPDILREIAYEYKKNGVEYAELSLSYFCDMRIGADLMKIVNEVVPKLEEETGVRLRFLGALSRESDNEWNLDDADITPQASASPYIVGCDFMGHERNSSYDIEEELRMFARYAILHDPNYTIRVHAGENAIFKSNVYDALYIINDEHDKLEKELGKKLPMPQVRIGHGLYGMDITEDGQYHKLEPGAVFDLVKKMNAVIEFNMSSNLALNNINSISTVPIKRYLDAGVRVVLGTDGHGLYLTSAQQEALLATEAGLSPEDFSKIREVEEEIRLSEAEREKTHPVVEDPDKFYSMMTYSTPDGKKRYTEEVAERYERLYREATELLDKKIKYTGVITDEERIKQDTEGKIPVLISGASKKSWPDILPKDQINIALAMQVLADCLDPDKSYVVTGGTNFGAEKTMHEAVHRRNLAKDKQLVLLGTFTMEATADGVKGIEKDTITHGMVLQTDTGGRLRRAQTWHDLPDTQLEYVMERKGFLIALGGGNIVGDMIQRAHNLGATMHLMKGPAGASTEKSASLEENGYSFVTIQDLLQRIYSSNPEIFNSDFSIEKVDEYIETARREIGINENFGIGHLREIDQTISPEARKDGMQKLRGEVEQEDKETVQNNPETPESPNGVDL